MIKNIEFIAITIIIFSILKKINYIQFDNVLFIFIIILFFGNYYFSQNNMEHLTVESNEAIQQISSLFNNGVFTLKNLNVTDTLNIGQWRLKPEGTDNIFVIRNTNAINDSRFAIQPDVLIDVSNKNIKTNTIDTYNNSTLNVNSNILSNGLITSEYINTSF
jgi:hypothetical protein